MLKRSRVAGDCKGRDIGGYRIKGGCAKYSRSVI